MSKRVTIVGSMKGGVGKTTMSVALVDMMRGAAVLRGAPAEVQNADLYQKLMPLLEKAAAEVVPYDVDVEPGKAVGTSSLSRRFVDTRAFAVAPSDETVVEDPGIVFSHFDQLGEAILEGDVVMDLGANVLNRFLTWAETGGAAKDWARAGLEVHFVTVCTADNASFAVASDGLERMQTLCGVYGAPLQGYVVLNRRDGAFDRYEGSKEWDRLGSLSNWVTSIHMHKSIASDLWSHIDVSDLPPSRVIAMTEEELVERFKLKPMQARRGWQQYVAWYMDVLQECLDVGLLGAAAVAGDAGLVVPAGPVVGKGKRVKAEVSAGGGGEG